MFVLSHSARYGCVHREGIRLGAAYLSLSLSIYIYIYIYVYMHAYIYVIYMCDQLY